MMQNWSRDGWFARLLGVLKMPKNLATPKKCGKIKETPFLNSFKVSDSECEVRILIKILVLKLSKLMTLFVRNCMCSWYASCLSLFVDLTRMSRANDKSPRGSFLLPKYSASSLLYKRPHLVQIRTIMTHRARLEHGALDIPYYKWGPTRITRRKCQESIGEEKPHV